MPLCTEFCMTLGPVLLNTLRIAPRTSLTWALPLLKFNIKRCEFWPFSHLAQGICQNSTPGSGSQRN